MCVLQSLLTVATGRRPHPTLRPVQADDDDDDVIDVTSRNVVQHRDCVGGRRYAGGVTSRGHGAGSEMDAALERSRDSSLVHVSSACGSLSANDVTVRSADRRGQYFPTPINGPPTMTVDHSRLERRNQLVNTTALLLLLHYCATTTTTTTSCPRS